MSRLNLAVAAISVGGLLVAPGLAEAHFRLNTPMSWMSQDAVGGPQKNGPCAATPNTLLGDSAGTPTGIVNAFTPGQTVSVSVTATVMHPGWWRISLHQGASSTQSLTTIPDPQAMAGTNCTPAFITNPVWSPTQPVIADKLGLPATATAAQAMMTQQSGTQTFSVVIPQNAVCTNASPCTLQVVMIMTDHPANDCYYHHCADIAAAGSTTGNGGSTGTTDAGTRDASVGTGGKTGAGGASGSGGAVVTGTGGASSGATGGAPSGGTGGSTTAGSGGTTGGGSGGAVAGSGGSSGGDQDSGTTNVMVPSDKGCSCATGGGAGATSTSVFLIALLALKRRRGRNAR